MKPEKGYMVVDVETTVKNTSIGKNKAFPFNDRNEIVAAGTLGITDSLYTPKITRVWEAAHVNEEIHVEEIEPQLLIGHNIKFDLHYLRKEGRKIGGKPIDEWLHTGNIWDTQSVEYILSGQSHLYPSLDQCAVKYGGTLKDDRIKILWKAGVQTEDIQVPMLNEYLRADLDNTEEVFRGQMELAKEKNLLPLIRSMNQAIIAYEEMEYNGMAVHQGVLGSLAIQNGLELSDIQYEIMMMIPKPVRKKINIGSTQHMSVLLFGGDIKYKEKVLVGKYKNGNDKYKIQEFAFNDPLFNLSGAARKEWKLKKFYQTTDHVLETLKGDIHHGSREHQFISLLQEYRRLEKERSSYYNNIPKLLVDGTVHQNINNTATHTGRLSQSDPNLQNVAKKGQSLVKSIFISRWGDKGQVVEADYSQLEVISLAFLSGDINLITDILSGTDVHTETHRVVKRHLPSDMNHEDQRRCVKAVNFGLIYGGGANTLAKQSGLEVSVVKKIIKAFYARYPGVKAYQQDQLARLELGPVTTKTKKGFPSHEAKLVSPTGREYTFNEYDNAPWAKRATGKDVEYSWTQLCNYECQGFATGDIVPTVIGYLFRALKADPVLRDTCLMINTVHDSIIFDVRNEVIEHAVKVIRNVMEDAPKIMKEVYGIDMGALPFKVQISGGPNWKEQHEIKSTITY